MPYARNAVDGSRVYFEDDGGEGTPVLILGGFLDPIDLVRGSPIAQALRQLAEEFRLVYVDHRGHGRSEAPHDARAYAMPLRVADAVAVLDELGIERAHFVGISWGGRLLFGIGQHAPQRIRSLVIVGQQPYASSGCCEKRASNPVVPACRPPCDIQTCSAASAGKLLEAAGHQPFQLGGVGQSMLSSNARSAFPVERQEAQPCVQHWAVLHRGEG
jgi:pimeloyl-ACP methyl ester carboxylesterase